MVAALPTGLRAAPSSQPARQSARRDPARGPLSLDITEASLEFSAETERRRVNTQTPGYRVGPFSLSDQRTRQHNHWQQFTQIGRIGLEGSVIDEEFFAYYGTLGLGFSQERYHENFNGIGTRDHAGGTLAEYDLHADIFRSGKVSGHVFGLQTNDRYARPFLPSLRERRSEFGTIWNLNDDVLPMELRLEHRDTQRDGARRNVDNERIKEDLLDYTATWNHLSNHTARLNMQYADRDENYSGSYSRFHTQRTQLRLDDSWQFGDNNRHRIDTIVRWQEERGTVQRDQLEIGPRLTLQHTPQLASHYQYQFNREQVGQIDISQHRADLRLTHQLFSNLVTTANLFGLHEDVRGDTESDEIGGSIDWAYTRDNRLGTFAADLGLTYEHEETRGGGWRVQLRESAAFRDPLPVVLYKPNVFIPSIVVWNSTRTTRFRIGRDYLVTRLRGRTLLLRQLAGRIAPGESVSVDYLYIEDRDARRDTARADFRVEQRFNNGITPYYALQLRDESRRVSLGTPTRDNDLNRHRLGVKYQQPRYALGVELEVLHDDVDPFVAYRAWGQRSLVQTPTASLDGRAEFSQFFFDNARDRFFTRYGDRDVALFELSIDGRKQLGRDLDARARIRYRYQDAQSRGITNGVDAEAGAEYRWGQFTLSATVEYDLLDIVDSRERGLGVWVKVRRDFSDLLAKAK